MNIAPLLVCLILGFQNDCDIHEYGSENIVPPYEFITIDLDHANPEADCKRAIRKDDMRFVGMLSFAVFVPGVDDYSDHYSTTNGVKIIKGTTDTPQGDQEVRFQDRAEIYAEAYNRCLLKYLAEKNKEPRAKSK